MGKALPVNREHPTEGNAQTAREPPQLQISSEITRLNGSCVELPKCLPHYSNILSNILLQIHEVNRFIMERIYCISHHLQISIRRLIDIRLRGLAGDLAIRSKVS